jgi:hypothetical protein
MTELVNKFDPGPLVDLSSFMTMSSPGEPSKKKSIPSPGEPLAKRSFKPRRKGRRGKRPPWRLAHAVARGMEPGRWYGTPDMARLSGLRRNPLDVIVRRMVRDGELERAENPAWRPVEYPAGSRIHVQNKGADCRYLWRLTPQGLSLRSEARLLD